MKSSVETILILFLLLWTPLLKAEISLRGTTSATSPTSCDGTITGIADGSSGPYTVQLTGGASQSNINGIFRFTGLCVGNYTITVSNAYGCSWTLNANIGVCQPLRILTAAEDLLDCEGENKAFVNITPDNGTAPYTYYWQDGITSEDRFNIGKGTYSVTMTDFNGCVGTAQYKVREEVISIVPNTALMSGDRGNCSGIIDISVQIDPPVNGATTLLWSNGQTTTRITNLCVGAYTVTVTSPSGCSKSQTFQILNCSNAANPIITGYDLSNTIDCQQAGGGTIVALVSGGTFPYTYQWSGSNTNNPYKHTSGNAQAPGITIGDTYNITITDGCFNAAVGQIYVPCTCQLGARDIGLRQVEPCFRNGRSAINLTNLFCWTPIVPNIHKPFDFKITWPNNSRSTLTVDQFTPCNTHGSTVHITGPDTYEVPSPGAYTVKVVDDYGCLSEFCFGFDIERRLQGYEHDALFNVLPSGSGFVGSIFQSIQVATGCFTCTTCSANCFSFNGTNVCQSGYDRSDIVYTPRTPALNPCQGGVIACRASGIAINVPDHTTGTPIIDWDHPIPGPNPACCVYNVGCWFPQGALFGVNEDIYVETTHTICNPDPTAVVCPTPPVSCPSIFRVYQTNRPCYYDEYCSDDPTHPIRTNQYDPYDTYVCYKPNNRVYSTCSYELVRRCLLAPGWPVMEVLEDDFCLSDLDWWEQQLGTTIAECDPFRPVGVFNEGISGSNKKSLQSHIFPNPFNDFIHIELTPSASQSRIQVRVVDAVGRIVYEVKDLLVEEKQTIAVPLEKHTSGVYLIEISDQLGHRNQHTIVKTPK